MYRLTTYDSSSDSDEEVGVPGPAADEGEPHTAPEDRETNMLLALGSDDKTASIVDARTGERRHHLRGLHTKTILGVAFPSAGPPQSKTAAAAEKLLSRFAAGKSSIYGVRA